MSNEIEWPAKPFYIESKIGFSNWALTADDSAIAPRLRLRRLDGSIDFLWTAHPDPRGGATLQHVKSGLYLTAHDQALTLAHLAPSDDGQCFRLENLGANWSGINKLSDWEQKINVYASDPNGTVGMFKWDGGADNEKWRLIQELGEVTTESVHYDMQHALTDLNLRMEIGASLVQDNRDGAVPLTGSQTLSRTITISRSITNSTSDTTGRKYTQTFGIKGGIEKVFEVNASGSFEESTSSTLSYTDQNTETKTLVDQQQITFNVPPGKRYRYQVVVQYGKCAIPYTANMIFQSIVAGTAPYRFVTSGTYTGVNKISSNVTVFDITHDHPSAATIVERRPL
ncbi:MAG TPA: aerolysin family beta-barrel pore-forming toxin [Thermoanaerobaculia bacterium]|jgi:hypothetical protein